MASLALDVHPEAIADAQQASSGIVKEMKMRRVHFVSKWIT
jgi:hypothetical protein